MTHEEKVKYFATALTIADIGIQEKYVDIMVSLYDLILENKGETNLKQIIHVKCEHKKRFPESNIVIEEKPKEDETTNTASGISQSD